MTHLTSLDFKSWYENKQRTKIVRQKKLSIFFSSVFACSFPYVRKLYIRRVSNLKKAHKMHDMGVLGFVFHSMTASLNFPLLCFFSCLAYA